MMYCCSLMEFLYQCFNIMMWEMKYLHCETNENLNRFLSNYVDKTGVISLVVLIVILLYCSRGRVISIVQ